MADAQPSDILLVSNLPANADDNLVRQIFGNVVRQCKVVPGADGCNALVQCHSTEVATTAKGALDGAQMPGATKPLRVGFAGAPSGGAAGCGGGGFAGAPSSDGSSCGGGKGNGGYGGGKGGCDGGKGGWSQGGQSWGANGGQGGWGQSAQSLENEGGQGTWTTGGQSKGSSDGNGGWSQSGQSVANGGGKGGWSQGGQPWASQGWNGGGWSSGGWNGGGWGKANNKGDQSGKGGRASPYEGGGGARAGESTSLSIIGLPAGVTEEWIRQSFGEHGTAFTGCQIMQAAEGPWSATIQFASADKAEHVKQTFQGANINGNALQIEFVPSRAPADTKPSWSEGGWSNKAGNGDWSNQGGDGDGGWSSNHSNGDWNNQGSKWSGNNWADGASWAARGSWNSSAGGGGYDGGNGNNGWGVADAQSWGQAAGAAGRHAKGTSKGGAGMQALLRALKSEKVLPGCSMTYHDNCLFIAGLPSDTDDLDLYKLCSPFGAIRPGGVASMKGPDGKCRGFGFINFVDTIALQIAEMALDGMQLPDGSALKANEKRTKGDGPPKGASGQEALAPPAAPLAWEAGAEPDADIGAAA